MTKRGRCHHRITKLKQRVAEHNHPNMAHANQVQVSYRALLEELDRRVARGWRPADHEYFSDLVFNLLANQYAAERSARGKAQRR